MKFVFCVNYAVFGSHSVLSSTINMVARCLGIGVQLCIYSSLNQHCVSDSLIDSVTFRMYLLLSLRFVYFYYFHCLSWFRCFLMFSLSFSYVFASV